MLMITHFETEPFSVQLPLPPIGTPLGTQLAFGEKNHLPYLIHDDQVLPFDHVLPPNFRRNVYILTISTHNPVMIDASLAAFRSCQAAHVTVTIEVWLVKRNNA
jgi:hypothetical protein